MWYTQWNLEEGITALYLSHIIDEVSSGTVLDVVMTLVPNHQSPRQQHWKMLNNGLLTLPTQHHFFDSYLPSPD